MNFTYIMNRDELHALIENARWFTHYFVRSKEIEPGRFRVTTNCRWIPAEGQ